LIQPKEGGNVKKVKLHGLLFSLFIIFSSQSVLASIDVSRFNQLVDGYVLNKDKIYSTDPLKGCTSWRGTWAVDIYHYDECIGYGQKAMQYNYQLRRLLQQAYSDPDYKEIREGIANYFYTLVDEYKGIRNLISNLEERKKLAEEYKQSMDEIRQQSLDMWK
jgi:hypothetical protein